MHDKIWKCQLFYLPLHYLLHIQGDASICIGG